MIEAVETTQSALNASLRDLRKKYKARNTRQLIYVLYERSDKRQARFVASARGLEIMKCIVSGNSYGEIALELGITASCVRKHLDKLVNDNYCQTINDLIVLYADWEHSKETHK